MRDNFRPNIRLATNILLVIGTFAIAFHLAPIGDYYRKKVICGTYPVSKLKKLFGENWLNNCKFYIEYQEKQNF